MKKCHALHTEVPSPDHELYSDTNLVLDLESQTMLLTLFLNSCYFLGFLTSAVCLSSNAYYNKCRLVHLLNRHLFLPRRGFVSSRMHASYDASCASSCVFFETSCHIQRNQVRFTSLELLY